MSKQIDRILAQGVIAGLLVPVEETPAHAARPWPLTVFTGIGAWFAAIPFAVLLLLIGSAGRSSALAILSVIVMGGATAVMRTRPQLFIEQLALAGMVASALAFYFDIAEKGNHTAAAVSLFLAFAAVAWIVPQSWLRALLGAAMGVTGIVGIYGLLSIATHYQGMKLLAVLFMSLFWCLLSIMPSLGNVSTQRRAALEAASLGMSAAIICTPFWVNDGFFFLEVSGWRDRWTHDVPAFTLLQGAVSVTVTLTSAAVMAWKWAPMRSAWFAMLTLVLSVFAWFIPALCVLVLIGAVALISGRKSTAILCAAMLGWWMGSFYFSLQTTLIYKAMLLAASGCAIAFTAAFMFPDNPVKPADPVALPKQSKTVPKTRTWAHTLAFAGCAVLTLGIANVSIMQKEAVAEAGTTLFVELAPVDPRSLMQGDYMRLAFGIGQLPKTKTPIQALVGTRDEHGVWTAGRPDDGGPLSSGEIKINLTGTADHPIFVTDAWFFKEGEANRWQPARYGEFRVKPDGSAVLIGLRGRNLEKL